MSRILAIAPTSFFADYGCHVRIRGQLGALRARGHDILLVTYPSGRDVDDIATCRAPWPGRDRIQVGSSRWKIVLDAVLGPTAAVAALRFRPDVLHAYLHEGALIGTLLARLLRRPLVFDFQGSLTGEMLDHRFISPRSRWLPILHRLERWIDRQPDAVLASSAHGARVAAERFGTPAGRIAVLPDSVDPARFRPATTFAPATLAALRARLGLPSDRRLIVYLGLLAPYQGTDLLLRAMVTLTAQRDDVHLLLMGFPHLARYRALAVQLGLAEHVTFTGAVPYEDAPAHLALGDVAVAPKLSSTEGSGKLLTYMAAALPVVAFDTPVHREYLSHLGCYARPGDADDLAAVCGQLLDDLVEARARGQALRARAAAHYTWEGAAAAIESVYDRLRRLPSGPQL